MSAVIDPEHKYKQFFINRVLKYVDFLRISHKNALKTKYFFVAPLQCFT